LCFAFGQAPPKGELRERPTTLRGICPSPRAKFELAYDVISPMQGEKISLFQPMGWVKCDPRSLPKSGTLVLSMGYSVIGSRYAFPGYFGRNEITSYLALIQRRVRMKEKDKHRLMIEFMLRAGLLDSEISIRLQNVYGEMA
jgi:hypothetical protein